MHNFFRSCDDFMKLSMTNEFKSIPQQVKNMFRTHRNINWMYFVKQRFSATLNAVRALPKIHVGKY